MQGIKDKFKRPDRFRPQVLYFGSLITVRLLGQKSTARSQILKRLRLLTASVPAICWLPAAGHGNQLLQPATEDSDGLSTSSLVGGTEGYKG